MNVILYDVQSKASAFGTGLSLIVQIKFLEFLERTETISEPSKFVGFATTKPAPSVQRRASEALNPERKRGGKRPLEPGSVQDFP